MFAMHEHALVTFLSQRASDTSPVSYTHLDVYKRQVMYGSPYRFFIVYYRLKLR